MLQNQASMTFLSALWVDVSEAETALILEDSSYLLNTDLTFLNNFLTASCFAKMSSIYLRATNWRSNSSPLLLSLVRLEDAC